MICEICKKEFKSFQALSGHLRHKHDGPQVYYDQFLGGCQGCAKCGKPTTWYRLAQGYLKYCSKACELQVNGFKPGDPTKPKLKRVRFWLSAIQPGDVPITCLICGAVCRNHRVLAQHCAQSHDGSKNYYDQYLGGCKGCLECGAPTAWKNLNLGYHKFCSQSCASSANNREMWKDPEYRASQEARLTAQWQTPEHREYATQHARDLNARRDTPEWREKYSAKAVEMIKDPTNRFGTRHGIRSEYAGINMRSSYEVAFAKVLDANGIVWQYEPTRIKFSDGSSTLPDFYLPEFDTFVEVKPEKLSDKCWAVQAKVRAQGFNYVVAMEPDIFGAAE